MQIKERCDSPVCHRITFMYAPLYHHEQLNEATHDTLHEMFGVANMQSFEHLALLTRKGHLVAMDGKEAYLPHLDRLAHSDQLHPRRRRTSASCRRAREITYDLLRESQRQEPLHAGR